MRQFWTASEELALRQAYSQPTLEDADLRGLAQRLGRSLDAVQLKAGKLGLTDRNKPKKRVQKSRRRFNSPDELKEFQRADAKRRIAEYGHPRGMLGKKHSTEVRMSLSQTGKAWWNSLTRRQQEDFTTSRLQAALQKNGFLGAPPAKRGTWKAGWREIGGSRYFFRSLWEANYARYLEWLKSRGEIAEWEYEPTTFWFEKIRRGVRSYKPDFRVTENNGSQAYHEVKGWMDSRSKTTLRRMAKYHPGETVIVIREKEYRAMLRTAGPLIEGLE